VFPVFLKLDGRRVLLVGGGRVAAGKLRALLDARANVTVVAPVIAPEIASAPVSTARRAFQAGDLDGVCYVVAAAPREVNAEVAREAGARGLFVNAVDDVENASAFAGAVLRRSGVIVAVSTDGHAPALAGLLREGLDALLPDDLDEWMTCARDARRRWLADGVPMELRRPLLLDALMALYPRLSAVAADELRTGRP
jgi:uroporphyrin-III C-methyltransferase/precorrin-2 dehydrogenase/sirohydrochlorin ferrochelatase